MTSLEEIKRLLSAATPGPWRVAGTSGFVENSSSDVATICQFWSNYEIDYDNWEANAQLIAKAPTLIAELIEQAERLQKVADAARGLIITNDAIAGRMSENSDDIERWINDQECAENALRQALEESK